MSFSPGEPYEAAAIRNVILDEVVHLQVGDVLVMYDDVPHKGHDPEGEGDRIIVNLFYHRIPGSPWSRHSVTHRVLRRVIGPRSAIILAARLARFWQCTPNVQFGSAWSNITNYSLARHGNKAEQMNATPEFESCMNEIIATVHNHLPDDFEHLQLVEAFCNFYSNDHSQAEPHREACPSSTLAIRRHLDMTDASVVVQLKNTGRLTIG